METLCVLQHIGVTDLSVDTARLVCSSVNDVVVGAALVGKTLAVAVHLQEGLGAGVELADLAGEGLAAKGAVAVHITGVHTGSHDTAVKQHGSSFLVQVSTSPHSGTDAVALVGRGVGAGGGDAGAQRIQLLHHVRVAAAGQQNALGCVVADEVVVIHVLGDDAGDAAGIVLFQLGQADLEVHVVAQLLDVLQQQFIAGRAGLALAGHVVVLFHGEEVVGVVFGVLGGPCSLAAGGEIAHPAVLVFQDAPHKVVHSGRLVDPGLDNALVALAGSVAGDLAQQLGTVKGLLTGSLGCGGVDGTVPVAGVLHVAVLLDDAEVQAVGSCIGGSKHTAVACTHNEDVGVHGLSDGSLVDIRLFAQPVVCVACGQLHTGHHGLTLCLCVAALGSLHHGIGGDGRAGNAVDLGRTGSHQLLTQLIGSGSAERSGLAGGVHHHVGDSAVGEGHGDLDGGGDALGGALVGAGNVLTGGTGGSGAGGGIAGGQSTGSDTAHGGGSGDLQKAFAGDLVHSGFLLFLFLCLFVIFGSALWKNLHRTNKNSLAYL